MIERRKSNDRIKHSTLDLLYVWAEIGPFVRMLVFVAIITTCVWLLASAVEIAAWMLVATIH